MISWISFRFNTAYLLACRLRCDVLSFLVTLTIVAFWIHSWRAWQDNKIEKHFATESKLQQFVHNVHVSGQFTSYCNGSSIPPTPNPRRETPVRSMAPSTKMTIFDLFSVFTPDIAIPKTIGYLMHRAPAERVGLGNYMFMYASLLGIADHAKMTPVYRKYQHLRKIFKISAGSPEVEVNFKIVEARCCALDCRIFSLSGLHLNATVTGYLQSWKYFSNVAERIRQEFTFNDELKAQADDFLGNLKDNLTSEFNDSIFIGIHIRRGDMTSRRKVSFGYTVASKEYQAVAVNYFRTNFPVNTLVVVVCTDDLEWSKQNFPGVDRNSFVAFSENRTAAQDMAILVACNHTIITVGTFGWWSGYLAGGRTIYYKDFPTPGSYMASVVDKADYFPPDWIGL